MRDAQRHEHAASKHFWGKTETLRKELIRLHARQNGAEKDRMQLFSEAQKAVMTLQLEKGRKIELHHHVARYRSLLCKQVEI